jgi:glycerate 2-kinase
VRGPGRGGRAQHLALLIAKEIAGREKLSLLALGSDGTDGPTGAAGAIVDGDTWAEIARAGVDPERALREYDSEPALRAAKSLLEIGATGTNVNDLYVLLSGEPPGPL